MSAALLRRARALASVASAATRRSRVASASDASRVVPSLAAVAPRGDARKRWTTTTTTTTTGNNDRFAAPFSAAAAPAEAAADEYDADAETSADALQSVVRVFTVHSSPNYFQPWANKTQRESFGSGVVVEAPVPGGVGVLTNAHVVADQTFVQVRRHGSSVKHQARVHAVGHECDLAVLTVDDPDFFLSPDPDAGGDRDGGDGAATAPPRRVRPLPLGDVPALQSKVSVMGFPAGGDNLSITSGIVSRVELTSYAHGAGELLAAQLDAAINPGNSGGPAVMRGKIVGIAFQNLPGTDNIGYVIPTPVIRRFLDDVERDAADARREGRTYDGVHGGFCGLGIKCQWTDNPAMRAYLGMGKRETGVIVTEVAPLSPAKGKLFADDVLLEIDGAAIANDGSVSFRGWERVAFDHLVSLKRAGENIRMKVRRLSGRAGARNGAEGEERGGEEDEGERAAATATTAAAATTAESAESEVLTVDVVATPRAPLVPVHQYDRLPTYFVFAGLVFCPLTQPHLHEWGDDWYDKAPRRLCDRAMHSHMKVPDEQVVILSHVLADEINVGYQGKHDLEVSRVCGAKVKNMRELAAALDAHAGEFVRVDFVGGDVIVVNAKEGRAAGERILAKHRVPARMSPDLAAGGGGGGVGRGRDV